MPYLGLKKSLRSEGSCRGLGVLAGGVRFPPARDCGGDFDLTLTLSDSSVFR